jgi:hypothetical protein
MMEMLTDSITKASSQGFTGLRTAGEMSWALRGRNLCDQILEYETMVDQCFPSQRVIGLCQYSIDEFSAEILESVLEHHRLHLSDTSSSSLHSSLQIRYGSYSAEVVADKFLVDPRYYYVVQQQQPREVIGWGVAPTFDSAAARAEQMVRNPGGSNSPTATA